LEQPYRLTLSGSINVASGVWLGARIAALGCAIVRYAHPVDYQAPYPTSQESVPPVCVERPR
jgi:hypothetical protein